MIQNILKKNLGFTGVMVAFFFWGGATITWAENDQILDLQKVGSKNIDDNKGKIPSSKQVVPKKTIFPKDKIKKTDPLHLKGKSINLEIPPAPMPAPAPASN